MKVSSLEYGMLLKPIHGLKMALSTEAVYLRKEKKDKNVTIVNFVQPSWLPENQNHCVSGPVIYLGSKFDQFVYDGVYKHHRLLVGDTIAILSGYHVKNLCPIGAL